MTTTRDPLARAAADTAARAELRRQHEARERLLNGLGSATIVALVRAVDRLERWRWEETMALHDVAAVFEARDAYLKSLAGEEL